MGKKTNKATALLVAAWIAAPSTFAADTVSVVEYYAAILDHYFITADADEISALDAGAFNFVWRRTGQSFLAYRSADGAAVCRFYSSAFAQKASHFYTANVPECDAVKRNPFWRYERIGFYIPLPDAAGNCPANTQPVYRMYNAGMTGAPNHRFTTNLAIRLDFVNNRGWVREGSGPIGVAMCAPDGTTVVLRDSFPARVAPFGPPPFACVAPGVATQAVLQRLNTFWESNVRACACDPFALVVAGCQNNAFVTSQGVGYIFYDRAYLDHLDLVSGSTLPADFLMAHEFGHNIQLAFQLNPPGKFRELQADCLGGYYVGHEARVGRANGMQVIQAFQYACSIGDPFTSNWWDPTHGTCAERVSAVQLGFNGYFTGALPGQACP